jgi:transposase-like protein
MFIYSVRASTLRFFGVLAVTVCLLVSIMAFSGTDSVFAMSNSAYSFSDVSTKEDRLEFLSQFGILAAADSESAESFVIPEALDRVMLAYNEIQKAQGLDLSAYCKKQVRRYTYEVKNYKDADLAVYVNLIVYRHRVIGGDISASGEGGFVLPFTAFEAKK